MRTENHGWRKLPVNESYCMFILRQQFELTYTFVPYLYPSLYKAPVSPSSDWRHHRANLSFNLELTHSLTCDKERAGRRRDGWNFGLRFCVSLICNIIFISKEGQEEATKRSEASSRLNGMAFHWRDSATLFSRP